MTEPKSVVLPITPRGSDAKFSKFEETAEGRLQANFEKSLLVFSLFFCDLSPPCDPNRPRFPQATVNGEYMLAVRTPTSFSLAGTPAISAALTAVFSVRSDLQQLH